MARIEGLLDSNVLIAALVETHEHHLSLLNLLLVASPGQFAVAAHSHAEAYSTLTRGGARTPFRFKPVSAMAALESLRAVTVLLGLTAAQTFEAIRDYARGDGIGPRL